jgi:pyruvate,water dikinase
LHYAQIRYPVAISGIFSKTAWYCGILKSFMKRNEDGYMQYIKWFKDSGMQDVALVGGKNASLGEMIAHLSERGIPVPNGFAITADAYWHVLQENNLVSYIEDTLTRLPKNPTNHELESVSSAIRGSITKSKMPQDLKKEIEDAYTELSQQYGATFSAVAVRSSATAEDLPGASFAGQQDTFLNITGLDNLCTAVLASMASLFTERALVYRKEKGFSQSKIALSVGVQKMIRSDLGSSGVAFSLDTETGHKDVVLINASFGLGEAIVQGLVTPDEYMVHKPTLKQGYAPIIKKQKGDKKVAIVYRAGAQGITTTCTEPVSATKRLSYALTDTDILDLARMVVTIEEYYSERADTWVPMDVEWAKDGVDQKLYIVQARPETVFAPQFLHKKPVLTYYSIKNSSEKKPLLIGTSVGQNIVQGIVRLVHNAAAIDRVKQGDIMVTRMTDPDWVPAMQRAVGIITEQGGRTCHAAIVSRELGIPAIIGVDNALQVLHDGQKITLDCSQGSVGYIYDGFVSFDTQTISLDTLPTVPVSVMVNSADPNSALRMSALPVAGVGLARMEFIITNSIGIHPLALVYPEKVTDPVVSARIVDLTRDYTDKAQFFVQRLARGIGMIAAAFYPRPVIVRTSDFKTNEYRNLIAGSYFEPQEENPMLGFRGASRYYHEYYKAAFALECAALKSVRETMGLKNIKIMLPFVRTVQEAENVVALMAENGLVRGADDLELLMMCEIPSNVILIDQFARCFDGFSIGSNDLTQLILGVDRDSMMLGSLFDERNEAVQITIAQAIKGAHNAKKYIGICGQAPSDYPEVADYLIKDGIDSLSLNADSVLPFFMRYKK